MKLSLVLSLLALLCAGLVLADDASGGVRLFNNDNDNKEKGNRNNKLKKRKDEERIPGSYIVVLQDDISEEDISKEERKATKGVRKSLRFALKGFVADLTDDEVQQLLLSDKVAYIEEDGKVEAFGSQSSATWGLDRIDQKDLPLNSVYNYPNDGTGVTAYIIDTGVKLSHSEFGGRASFGANFAADGVNDDCNGHGTHVAGTVAGSTYGVAKQAKIVDVKVLNCQGSGSWSGVISGVDWVRANHKKPAVVNMSLGGGKIDSLNTAVANLVAAGVTVVVAAGNSNADACTFSPASTTSAITVGATTNTDARASFSNYGSCVDIFAPGQSITAAWNNGAYNTISGTSMASPHVCGVAALILSNSPGLTPAQVFAAMQSAGVGNKVSNPGVGSPNLLLQVPQGVPASVEWTRFVTSGGGEICTSWTDFKSKLVGDYNKVSFIGPNGKFVAVDSPVVNGIRDALRYDTVYTGTAPDGNVWSVCNRYGGELWINPVAQCSPSNCPNPGFILRACISNSNWGGFGGATCGNAGQQITVKFAKVVQASGSCYGKCGGLSGSCYCDAACHSYGDCCADKTEYCGNA